MYRQKWCVGRNRTVLIRSWSWISMWRQNVTNQRHDIETPEEVRCCLICGSAPPAHQETKTPIYIIMFTAWCKITAICNLRTWPRLYLEVNQLLKHLRRPTSSFPTYLCDYKRFDLQTAMRTYKYIITIFLLFITENLVSWGSVMMRSYFMDAFFLNSVSMLSPI
jgi:hypothetical protein